MVLKIISDNLAAHGLKKEHGFSLMLEGESGNYLFDTGRGEAFISNAETLSIDISSLNGLILSHGHYDHGGNIHEVLKRNPRIKLTAHPDILVERYSIHPGKDAHFIGLSSENRNSLKTVPPENIQWISGIGEVAEQIWVVSDIPRQEKQEDDFFLNRQGTLPDPLHDDLSLLIRGDLGYSLICGCCHSGLRNTYAALESHFPEIELHSIIGGFHLSQADDKTLEQLGRWMNRQKIQRVVPCHCSGEKAAPCWSKIFQGETIQGQAGLVLEC